MDEKFLKRFWAKVNKTDTCWLWTACTRNGYGSITVGYKDNGRSIIDYSHRISYRLHFEEIPEGTSICHNCDTPRCVNPSHLFVGTPKINSLDMVKKNRQAFQEKNGRAKLTSIQIQEIRSEYDAKRKTAKELAIKYGVNRSCIYKIINKVQWNRL